jgi:hypothetical protein
MTAIATPRTTPFSSSTATRVGRVLTGLVSAFLLLDSAIHLLNIAVVEDGARTLGFDPATMPFIGLLELACLALYVVPRTSLLGAVLLTGYLGGAFCAQLRIEAPVFSTLLFPVYVGVLAWAGLYLRDARLRGLVSGRA